MPIDRPMRGFTLIEVLVAMALLALMSSFTYRAVSSILEAEEHVKQSTRRWQDLSLFFEQFELDAMHAISRPIRDGHGTMVAEWVLRKPEGAGQEPRIEWTRLADGAAKEHDSRRIGYRLRDGKLEYLQWPVLDRAPSTEPRVITVVEGVRELRLRCLTDDGRWLEVWPIAGLGERLPRAVEVIVVLDGDTKLTRLIPVRGK